MEVIAGLWVWRKSQTNVLSQPDIYGFLTQPTRFLSPNLEPPISFVSTPYYPSQPFIDSFMFLVSLESLLEHPVGTTEMDMLHLAGWEASEAC